MGILISRIFRTANPLIISGLLIFAAASVIHASAYAQSPPAIPSSNQAAQTALQVFVAVADAAGAPIPQEAVPVMQGMVNCALNGTPVGDCAKNIAISTALSEVAKSGVMDTPEAKAISDAAGCLTSGQAAQACLVNTVVAQLPPEAQPLATCIGGGGNVGDCAMKAALTEASQHVPKEAADVVGCVANGSALASCAQKLVTSEVDQALAAAKAPAQVKLAVDAMVSCVSDGGNAGTCAERAAGKSLPPEVQALQTCLTGKSSTQTCLANFAAKNISDPTASAVVGCMGQTSTDKVQQCLANNAKQALGNVASQAAQQALVTAANTIANLQLDSPIQDPPKFPEQPAILQNILAVAQGIQQGNWLLVVKGIGPEAAEVAGKIILSVFLTPALSDVLSPVVDSMIQNDVNAFTNGVTDLGKGDAVGVGEDIFKWYETQYIQAPCALMPDGKVRNTICNGLASAINWVADEGGALAKDILGIGKDILKDLGLWNAVDDIATTVWNGVTSVIDDIGHFLGLSHDEAKVVCVNFPSPSDYFANNVLGACLSAATSNAAASTPANMSPAAVGNVVNQCTSLYNLCATTPAAKQAVQTNCGKMGSALSQMANSAASGLQQAANRYAQTAVAIFASKKFDQYKKGGHPADICSTGFWSDNLGEYAASCAAAVGAPVHMPANTCPANTITPTYDALTQACITSLKNSPNLTNAVAGPSGSICKKWELDASTEGPCRFTDQTSIVLPSGQILNTHLDCSFRRPQWADVVLRPDWAHFVPFLPHRVRWPLDPWEPQIIALIHPAPKLPTIMLPERTIPPVIKLNPGAKLPIAKQPDIGGGSGAARIEPPVARLPGSGGASSAMDNAAAAAMGGGLNGVAGNAGSASIRPGAINGSGTFGPGSPVSAPIAKLPNLPATKGGSGGINMVNGNSGNAPIKPRGGSGGINMVNGQSGNAPVKPKSSNSSGPIDYGACPGCGQSKFVEPK